MTACEACAGCRSCSRASATIPAASCALVQNIHRSFVLNGPLSLRPGNTHSPDAVSARPRSNYRAASPSRTCLGPVFASINASRSGWTSHQRKRRISPGLHPVSSSRRTTGCRRSEVLNLRWRDIGEDVINLRDSKTGPRAVPLGEAARALSEALPGPCDPDAFLFPHHAEGRGIRVLTNCWRAACADAKLGGLRLHDLRHTVASQAVMSGEGLPLVGRLLGHSRHHIAPRQPALTWPTRILSKPQST